MRRLLYLAAALYLLPLVPSHPAGRMVPGLCFADSNPLVRFFQEDDALDSLVDRVVKTLSYREMIAELIVTSCGDNGRDFKSAYNVITDGYAGGVMFIGASSGEIGEYILQFNSAAAESSYLLPLYAVDGEPLLIHDRITDIPRLQGAGNIGTEQQCREVALYISMVLKSLGVHVNYAPVCDYSYNREVIGSRSFGRDFETVSKLSEVFISTTQSAQVAATAKHFPGHGSVEGDSHMELLFIQGDPLEIPVFRHAIENGVLFVMVGHIGVQGSKQYGTENLPSSLSRTAITDILKGELGFEGIVITDALKMKAVESFESPGMQALAAGADMVLMPEDEALLLDRVRYEMGVDDEFRMQIEDSVRKIVRLKVLLGLINKKKLQKTGLFDDIY